MYSMKVDVVVDDCPILFFILSVRCFSIFPIEAPQSKSLAATVRDTIDRFSRKFCLGQQLFNAISSLSSVPGIISLPLLNEI